MTAVQKPLKNVSEAWEIYDTVLVSAYYAAQQNGWFSSFTNFGNAGVISFFNVRNRQVGLSWNNQDTRDQMAFPVKAYGFGITFFGPGSKTLLSPNDEAADDLSAHIWEVELPRHIGVELQINQDIHIETNSMMTPAGYGTVGGAYGRGNIGELYPLPISPAITVGFNSQGSPLLNNRWKFPKPIQIPRRANISARLRISEYATQMLNSMPGPWGNPFRGDQGIETRSALFGVRIHIVGQRQVQQRGQYWA
jgi:hypothetical protein